VPDVELSEEDLNALGSLTKKSSGGQSYNPYAHIDNKYLNLSTADEFDDDEWLYMTEEQKPRNRTGQLFINTGASCLVGGMVGVFGAARILNQRRFLNLASVRHPVKRSEIVTQIVQSVRVRAGQFGGFGCWVMGTAAIMDLQSSKHALAKRGLPEELPLHYSAALGGFTYGLLGGKVWNVDYLRNKPSLLKQFDSVTVKPPFFDINKRTEYQIFQMYKAREKVPRWINFTVAASRCGLLALTASTITFAMKSISESKYARDIKRWKW